MSNQRYFIPRVQDLDCQSDSEHFVKESRDYLLSKSGENQSENDSESTDNGLIDLQTIKFICQHHVSGYVCLV